MSRAVHPIEVESYRRMRAAIDFTHLPPLTRAVVERIVHASADADYVSDTVTDEPTLQCGLDALRAGAPIVADVRMVAAGITTREVVCGLDDPRAEAVAAEQGMTRSAAGILLAAEVSGPGAVYVVGNAPTALLALVLLAKHDPVFDPALIIGLPVGFVDAAESKQALRESGLPQLSNTGPKGGSAVAAAAVNALLYIEETR